MICSNHGHHGTLVALVLAVASQVGCAHGTSNTPAAPAVDAVSGGERDLVELVPVKGYSLFIACRGKGRPTIVLETGFTDPGITWGRGLFRRVSALSRACVYDRAGLGYSDRRPDVTDSGKVAADLHALLAGAQIEPPYVLVGHSIGGMHVRVYDRAHPGDVAGMVLVDASHPDQFLRAQQRLSPADWAIMERSVRTGHADTTKEPLDWTRSSSLAREAGLLGDRPLQVLSHARDFRSPCQGDACLSREGTEIWEGLWQELQTDLAALSRHSTHVVVPGSGHYIHNHDPDTVIAAIASVIEQAD
jgi:pimeloyl-ACP methyl ester carboxylesterase